MASSELNKVYEFHKSFPQYEKTPLIELKATEQLEEVGIKRPTHVFVQAGVGSLAGAVVGYFVNKYPDNPPIFVIKKLFLNRLVIVVTLKSNKRDYAF